MPSEQHPFAIDFNVMLYGKCGKIERGGVKSNRYTKEFGRVPGSSEKGIDIMNDISTLG